MIGLLLVMMVLDVASGMCAAVVQGELSSKVSFVGMMRKCSILLIIGAAAALESMQPDLPLSKLTAGFFVINEGLSVLENARKAGVPIPPILSRSLDGLLTDQKGKEESVQVKVRQQDGHTTVSTKVETNSVVATTTTPEPTTTSTSTTIPPAVSPPIIASP